MGNGCSWKTFGSKKYSVYIKSIQKSSNIKVPLTSREISMLKTSWPSVKPNWFKICLVAFERWFTLYPQLRYMFRSLSTDLQFEDLFKSEALKIHVEKVKGVVELLIDKIDDVEDLVNTLVDIGRQHYMIGAEQKYATALAISLQYGICMIMDVDSCVENAWDSLLRFVMDLLKMGIRLEKENQKQEIDNEAFDDNDDVNNKDSPSMTRTVVQKISIEGNNKNEDNNNAPKSVMVESNSSIPSIRTYYVAEADDPNG